MIAVSSWQRDVAGQLAERYAARGWRVEPIVLDGERLLRVSSRDVADRKCLLDPARRTHNVRLAGGWVWAGDVPCPPEPLHQGRG